MDNLKLSICSRLGDLLSTGKEFNIPLEVLNKNDSNEYIIKTFKIFNPLKDWGHIQIGRGESLSPSENYQYIYSLFIKKSPLFVIFEQNHKEDKDWVLKVNNGNDLAKLLYENGSIEYFLSDKENSFFVAVNRYCIEYVGDLSFVKKNLDKFNEENNLEDLFK